MRRKRGKAGRRRPVERPTRVADRTRGDALDEPFLDHHRKRPLGCSTTSRNPQASEMVAPEFLDCIGFVAVETSFRAAMWALPQWKLTRLQRRSSNTPRPAKRLTCVRAGLWKAMTGRRMREYTRVQGLAVRSPPSVSRYRWVLVSGARSGRAGARGEIRSTCARA